MVKIKKNVLVEGASGRLGDIVFKTMKNGTTYISQAPKKSKKGNTKKRKATRTSFSAGVTYAQGVLASEEARAYYAEYGSKKRRLYNLAISDYIQGPDIKKVTEQCLPEGRMLEIMAVDNVHVCRLTCSYTKDGSEVVAEAEAAGSHHWQAAIPAGVTEVKVRAYDRPGNVAELIYRLLRL